jgi:hypothetical protein
LVGYGRTESVIVNVLSDGNPRSFRDIVETSRLGYKSAESALRRLWKSGAVMRTVETAKERNRIFKGRGGIRANLRSYHLYLLAPSRNSNSLNLNGTKFIRYNKRLAKKNVNEVSKAQLVLNFLEENSDKAFYSKEIVDALKDRNVKPSDVMTVVRKAERKGLVYVRGYKMHDKQTPFKEGYLLTWITPDKNREKAIEQAVEKTNVTLSTRSGTNPIIERIHAISDSIVEATKLRDLVSFEFLQSRLNCSLYETGAAVKRALQLYPDLRELKVFGIFKYYYHSSISEEDLKAAVAMKENYVRAIKGRLNRIGHNWEGAVEYFLDSLTTGAKFWTQKHRTDSMDQKRITIHLIKPVAHRKSNAEVDRVWEVTPGPLLKPTTYVLECKWGLVRKKYIDDFFEVLRWSKDFGVDTPEGRTIKQGVVGVFAGSAFNPKENVRLKDESVISLATYAARMNIQLLKAADFNEKMRERGVAKEITVQRICKAAKGEKEVREVLQAIWENPEKSNETLSKMVEKNKDVYDFEKMLEDRN